MKISNGVNKKISFPIAIIIIIVCAVLVGGIAVWQCKFIPKIEIPPFTPSEKPPADWKSCSIDSDCICCDEVLKKETDISLEEKACINKDYNLYDIVECIQIEHPDAFCAKNICKCEDNKCITTPEDETADKEQTEDVIFEIQEESLGEVGLVDLKEGKNKVGDIIIEKIVPQTGSESIRLERPEENIIIYKIDETIKVMTPDYRNEGSSAKFSMGYVIYYENKEFYRDIEFTALDVYKFTYDDKEYFAVETGSAGTGGYFSSLSVFIINREEKEVRFLGEISADGSLEDILNQIYHLIKS